MSTAPKAPRVDATVLDAFYTEYRRHSDGSLDTDAVALALKAVLELTSGEEAPLREGFIAYGEIDQSEGRGGRRTIGRYPTLGEALSASRGQGVQGSSGSVSWFKETPKRGSSKLYGQGPLDSELTEVTIFEHRQKPDGSYGMGFLDLREYEFGVRPASLGPVRPFNASILAGGKPALSEVESMVYPPQELSEIILSDIFDELPGEWVGLWRRVGDNAWRGEFALKDNQGKPPRWMPTVRTLERIASTRA